METEKVFNRKKELIKRDPLFKELTIAFHEAVDNSILEEIRRFYATHSCSDKIREKHKKKYPEYWKLLGLEQQLRSVSSGFVSSKYTSFNGIAILFIVY